MDIVEHLIERARSRPRTVVLPEGEDPRILQAARRLHDGGIARPMLIGERAALEAAAAAGVSIGPIESVSPVRGRAAPQAMESDDGGRTRGRSSSPGDPPYISYHREAAPMPIGVPEEIEDHEYRVGLTPNSVNEVILPGHDVIVERGAGDAIGAGDAENSERTERQPDAFAPTTL